MSSTPLPLTAGQLGIWLGQALDPESTAYWAAECIELIGALDVTAFERAHARAVRETEALRSRFRLGENGPEQLVDELASSSLQRLDLRDCESTFYSDSINDLPLLSAVRHPVAVNPDMRLAAVAAERGWPVLRLRDLAG